MEVIVLESRGGKIDYEDENEDEEDWDETRNTPSSSDWVIH